MSTHDKFYSITLRWILRVTAKEDGSTYTESGTTDVGASGNSLDDAIASAKLYLRDHLVHNYSGWHGKRCDMTKADVTMTSVEAKIVFSGKIALKEDAPEDLLRKWAPVTRSLPLSGLSQIEEASAILDKALKEGGKEASIAACEKIRADAEAKAGWPTPKKDEVIEKPEADGATESLLAEKWTKLGETLAARQNAERAPEAPVTAFGMPMKTMGSSTGETSPRPPRPPRETGSSPSPTPSSSSTPRTRRRQRQSPTHSTTASTSSIKDNGYSGHCSLKVENRK